MIDRGLNYGRHLISEFSARAVHDRVSPVVLDIGAGSGTDLQLVQERVPNARLNALEAYPPNVETLRQKKIAVHSLNLETEAFPFADRSVDLVLANQVLEHTKEIFWICHEVTRILKDDGYFLIGVPNLASFHNRALLMLGRQPTAIQTASAHIRGFTKHDLLRFFGKCFPDGYELVAFGGSNFYPFPPAIAKPLAAIWGGGAVSIFLLLRKRRPYAGSFIEYPEREKLETNYFLGPSPTA